MSAKDRTQTYVPMFEVALKRREQPCLARQADCGSNNVAGSNVGCFTWLWGSVLTSFIISYDGQHENIPSQNEMEHYRNSVMEPTHLGFESHH